MMTGAAAGFENPPGSVGRQRAGLHPSLSPGPEAKVLYRIRRVEMDLNEFLDLGEMYDDDGVPRCKDCPVGRWRDAAYGGSAEVGANHAAAGLVGTFFGSLFTGPWMRWILGTSSSASRCGGDESRVRTGLSAGGSRIRTLGPPVRDSIFSRPPRTWRRRTGPVARAGF
jgi:hypothetical protein